VTIQLETNNHDVYRCHSCDVTFPYIQPYEGFIYLPSNIAIRWDEDNDFLAESKVLVGKPGFACHNEDGSCLIESDGWSKVEDCEMWVCKCGTTYTFDNERCTDHAYSTKDDALEAAKRCCNDVPEGEAPAAPAAADNTPKVDDEYIVMTNRPEGAHWDAGTRVIITEVGGDRGDGSRVLRARAVGEDVQWNCYSTSLKKVEKEASLDDIIANKFTPKKGADKKVTYIEF
jgi:hypothetical protein